MDSRAFASDVGGPGVDDAILLMGHGSQDPEGVAEFVALAGAVRAASPCAVEAGVLEFWGPGVPSIAEAIDRCAARGARRVLAVPLLLHHAGHSQEDTPAQVAQGQARYPELEFRAAPPLAIHPCLLEIAEERIGQLERGLRPAPAGWTAILLVGRGSTDPGANGDFFKVGRLLWERSRRRLFECCFVSLAEPNVPAGIDRCVRLGARRILVMPYFLHTGVLVKRMAQQSLAAGVRYPGVEIAVGEPLGVHAKLVQLILDRARDLAEGPSDGAHL